MKIKCFLAYCLSYGIWAAWRLTEGAYLPSGLATSFMVETVMKAVIWLAPLGGLLCRKKHFLLISPKEFFSPPFPWYATFLGLSLTVAFLHTMHIVLVGIDTWGLYQPIWIWLSLSAAVIEELSFRGLLFNMLAPTLGVKNASVVNGLLFALYHFPEFLAGQNLIAVFEFRFWMITVMGTLFSYALAKWKHLGMNIVIHFVWNMLCHWFALT